MITLEINDLLLDSWTIQNNEAESIIKLEYKDNKSKTKFTGLSASANKIGAGAVIHAVEIIEDFLYFGSGLGTTNGVAIPHLEITGTSVFESNFGGDLQYTYKDD